MQIFGCFLRKKLRPIKLPQALEYASRRSHISFAAEKSAKAILTSSTKIVEDVISKTIKADLHVLMCVSVWLQLVQTESPVLRPRHSYFVWRQHNIHRNQLYRSSHA